MKGPPADILLAPAGQQPKFHPYPFWSPRFWHGMRLRIWLRLVSRHHYDIHPLRWPMFVMVTGCAVTNSLLGGLQNLILGRQIAETSVHESPLFILGHWRSGTTYLHELLSLDDRFVSPTTYQCFAPHHFLLTQRILTHLVWIPSRRPMDNVKLGWKQPQEDEFALCIMGAHSPYSRLAFPNHAPENLEYLDMSEISDEGLRQWKAVLLQFMRQVSYRAPKPLLLKSPTHTGRIKVLLDMFPKARFVHIVRDPLAVVPSTVRLWQSLESVQGLQLPKYEYLVDYVFDAFDRMYRGFDASQHLVAAGQICTLRYEDLVNNPAAEIAKVYEELDLQDFESVSPKLDEYVRGSKEYRTNSYDLSPRLRREISQRCAQFMQRYGYTAEHAPT